MNVLEENVDIWKRLFSYLDLESRVNMNRTFRTREANRFTREQIELHDAAVQNRLLAEISRKHNPMSNSKSMWFLDLVLDKRNLLILSLECNDRIYDKCCRLQENRDAGKALRDRLENVKQYILGVKKKIKKLKYITVS
jgi:hypothetical protein